MTQIVVKSIKPDGFYEKTFDIPIGHYDKLGDAAMEVMTRAVEEVVQECKKKSGKSSTVSRSFVKHFFSSFGPIIWAFEEANKEDVSAHYTTLTELALRNAGYSNLSSLVNKCSQKLNDELEGGEFNEMDDDWDDEGDDEGGYFIGR